MTEKYKVINTLCDDDGNNDKLNLWPITPKGVTPVN